MFNLTSVIIRTEIFPIEYEKLVEDDMALFLAKLIILFSSFVSVGGGEFWFHFASQLQPKSAMLW